MADPSGSPDADGPTDAGPGNGAPPRAPRWVVVSGIVVGVLLLLAVLLKLTGLGGDHGPGRHMGADGIPAAVTKIQTSSGGGF